MRREDSGVDWLVWVRVSDPDGPRLRGNSSPRLEPAELRSARTGRKTRPYTGKGGLNHAD